MQKKKNVHIITDLYCGGAEMMLFKLLVKLAPSKQYQFFVISLAKKSVLSQRIEKELGIKVYSLNLRNPLYWLIGGLKILKICFRADIIQTWMYHANFVGFLASKMCFVKKLIWTVHSLNLDPKLTKTKTLVINKWCTKLSKYVDNIVYCSKDSKLEHELQYLYSSKNSLLIPIGFDVSQFSFISSAKEDLAKELGFSANDIIITLAARWAPEKAQHIFLQAVALLKSKEGLKVIMCGEKMDGTNKYLAKIIVDLDLQNEVCLLGLRKDVPLIMSATDIYVSSSLTEAFPNVLGEAMLCQTPCVYTRVGECEYIVGDCGFSAEPNDVYGLRNVLQKMLDLTPAERQKMGKKARQRILDLFNISQVAKQYENLW